ncbi:hypothetical protein [Clostridium sp. ZBS13]|uniref:hypothetical protein n=1 Tax=Clostridium sp. ZBS13 TaxID=2949971 RepID=UPI002079C022|nr:hypothetical protein [Clostridium sp. ZBS13]
MNDIFTYEDYKNLLVNMKKIGGIFTFSSLDKNIKSGFVLRHDVDFDLGKAYKMFEIEKNLNVKSTYFILTTSDLYNINSKINRDILIKMNRSGFEIGLHFDPTIYGGISLEDMIVKVREEANIIENIIENKIKSISLHNPSIHNQYPKFDGYINAYSKEFFNSDLYISDSCKNFRGKNLNEFIEKGKHEIIQVLFHPIHFGKEELTYVTSFNKIIKSKIENFDKSMQINNTYKGEIENRSLLECFVDFVEEKSNEK